MGAPEPLLTTEECAGLCKMRVREFLLAVQAGRIPAVRINSRVFRFHWPTVLAALTGKRKPE
jgi:hypothetical protein